MTWCVCVGERFAWCMDPGVAVCGCGWLTGMDQRGGGRQRREREKETEPLVWLRLSRWPKWERNKKAESLVWFCCSWWPKLTNANVSVYAWSWLTGCDSVARSPLPLLPILKLILLAIFFLTSSKTISVSTRQRYCIGVSHLRNGISHLRRFSVEEI